MTINIRQLIDDPNFQALADDTLEQQQIDHCRLVYAQHREAIDAIADYAHAGSEFRVGAKAALTAWNDKHREWRFRYIETRGQDIVWFYPESWASRKFEVPEDKWMFHVGLLPPVPIACWLHPEGKTNDKRISLSMKVGPFIDELREIRSILLVFLRHSPMFNVHKPVSHTDGRGTCFYEKMCDYPQEISADAVYKQIAQVLLTDDFSQSLVDASQALYQAMLIQ